MSVELTGATRRLGARHFTADHQRSVDYREECGQEAVWLDKGKSDRPDYIQPAIIEPAFTPFQNIITQVELPKGWSSTAIVVACKTF